ncbi:flagellar hook-associated protein 3 FlgL [Diaminobutyricimonas aerilata]|uniref:Flagellar hook-associated protein 3 FlgL n=1 Tax=Diaminobutyricimonas aerilata TaxID=1162967 RepID=A0A2M9CN32_9MICO|nr:flagellar hook-associated protein FlgL [Diaminobutyricimonas aerilata]PJJ73301.1 flagellar hook-associated protein 3 FlgL [Diaminobutyricimonas aerilata]
MIGRITGQLQLSSAQRNLQVALAELTRLSDQASSGKLISKPSDDPAGTADSMQVRGQIAANAQFSRNIADGTGWLNTVESALSATTDILVKVRDLTVQASNSGSLSPVAREAIAVELEGLRSELFAQANTEYLGRSVFAGNSDEGVAFRPDLSYTGVAGSTVERRVDATSTVRVDADGAAVYGTGATSAFALIDTIVADVRGGTADVSAHLDSIDARLQSVWGEHTVVGARYAQLERAKGLTMEQSVSLEAQRLSVEDVDLGKTILDLKMQEVAYQSALAVTSRALQPTLLSFLS